MVPSKRLPLEANTVGVLLMRSFSASAVSSFTGSPSQVFHSGGLRFGIQPVQAAARSGAHHSARARAGASGCSEAIGNRKL